MGGEQTINLGDYAKADWTLMLHDRVITHFTIHEGTKLTIGRSEEADISIDNTAISRLHASLELKGGVHFLTDLGSTNGTTVNGERISGAVPVTEKDVITIGKFRLVPEHVAGEQVSKSYSTAMDIDDQTVFVSAVRQQPREQTDQAGQPSQADHKLMVVEGEAAPREISLKGRSSIKIGKDPSCDLIVDGFLVARAQCFVVSRKDKFFLVPQSSWTATKLNEVSIGNERLLRKGDIIAIRRTKIRFE
ncbi:MAG: FHA domain-containing protein [Thermodesulfobacteriota bacterium]